MKNIMYDIIGDFGEELIELLELLFNSLISVVHFIANSFSSLITAVGNGILAAIANVFKMSLWLIDRDRVSHTELVIDQYDINTELEILMNVNRVKEDALERKTWTGNHSMALNELSSRLYNECNWDETRIHQYMRNLVEAIPGLSYVSGNDSESDDSIDLED
jgi:hypothetical protein